MSGRGNWGSRFGFIMAAAGSAIGLGNIWRFPYMTGSNGGGAFLLIYLGIVIGFGLSLAMAEMALGRAAQRNPVGAFRMLGGGAWPLVGYLGVFTGFVILSFYIVVAGWTLAYMGFMARGLLTVTDAGSLTAFFNGFVSSPIEPIAYAGLFMLLTALIVAGGIDRGIERWNKILMPALFIILVILLIRAVTLPGADQGLAFFLVPDFGKVTAGTFRDAIAQAFFSLSIGMGAMLTYGSYLRKEENLPSAALTVVLLDTSAAVLAGLMILPAVFAAGLSPGAGGVRRDARRRLLRHPVLRAAGDRGADLGHLDPRAAGGLLRGRASPLAQDGGDHRIAGLLRARRARLAVLRRLVRDPRHRRARHLRLARFPRQQRAAAGGRPVDRAVRRLGLGPEGPGRAER
jgi:neurotransmitter:Na+ symporter, NSS family